MFSWILRWNATDFQKYQCQRDATIYLSTPTRYSPSLVRGLDEGAAWPLQDPPRGPAPVPASQHQALGGGGPGQQLVSQIILMWHWTYIRAGWPPKTSFATLDDQLSSMSGAHGLKDFLCSAHLLESFEGRIYSLKNFHKCKFVHQRTQEDGHYRENPWNHELLTLRGVDRRG